MKVIHVQCPMGVDCHYLTPGKIYEPIYGVEDGSFTITDDQGTDILCAIRGCLHLNGGDWILQYGVQYIATPEDTERLDKFAIAAMQGLCSNPVFLKSCDDLSDEKTSFEILLSEQAIQIAKEMIKRLNTPKDEQL